MFMIPSRSPGVSRADGLLSPDPEASSGDAGGQREHFYLDV